MVVVGAIILTWDNRIVLGFYATFPPHLSKYFYYSIYFAGLALKSLPNLQAGVKRRRRRFAVLAAAVFCGATVTRARS